MEQKKTRSLTVNIASAKATASSRGPRKIEYANRDAVFGPIPGKHPSSSIRSETGLTAILDDGEGKIRTFRNDLFPGNNCRTECRTGVRIIGPYRGPDDL